MISKEQNRMNHTPVNWEDSDIQSLVEKYDKPGPRYTSYPPATFFNPGFNCNQYIEQVKQSNIEGHRNLSFYFHVPFCPQLCYFCGCNTTLAQGPAFTERYIDAMVREFRQVAQYIDPSRKVSQIHWGGGTPNSINMRHVQRVMELVTSCFTMTEDCEVAMECNPAYMDEKQIGQLAAMGFNRISIGIQDFDLQVLMCINRLPSKLPVEELTILLQDKKMSVNFDFVYGLPGQTIESFEQNMQRAAVLKPNRIVTFSYAHVPWVKAAQKELEKFPLPDAKTKFSMYGRAYNSLINLGYQPIGLDHFALPDDNLAQSAIQRQLHRNFMGYCSLQNTGQVYAFGATSISQLYNCYAQNNKDTLKYMEAIAKQGIATEKGYQMTLLDKIGQKVIESIMCNQFADFDALASGFQLTTTELLNQLKFNRQSIVPYEADELVHFDGHTLQFMPHGRLFMRNVAMLFDPQKQDQKSSIYSKTI